MKTVKLFIVALAFLGITAGVSAQNKIEILKSSAPVTEAIDTETVTVKVSFTNTSANPVAYLKTKLLLDSRFDVGKMGAVTRDAVLEAGSTKDVNPNALTSEVEFEHRGFNLAANASVSWQFEVPLRKLTSENCNTSHKLTATHQINLSDPAIQSEEAKLTVNATKEKTDEVMICEGALTTLKASIPGLTGMNYLWSTGEITESISVKTAGEYTAHLIHPTTGCTSRYTFNVKTECYASVPGVITPNNDGHNDRLEATLRNVETFEIQIFNQGGHLAYTFQTTNEPTDPHTLALWDGKIGSQEALEGVYFFRIKARTTSKSTFERSGNITLLR